MPNRGAMRVHAGCYPSEILAAYQEGTLPAPQHEAFERHAVVCKACRDTLLGLGVAREPAEAVALPETTLQELSRLAPALRSILPRRRLVAAAVVLASAALAWLALRPAKPSSLDRRPSAATTMVGAFPRGLLGSTVEPRAYLADGSELLLQAGAWIHVEETGRRLQGQAGTFWVEVRRGEPLILKLPGGALTLHRGTLAVRISQAAPASWIRLLPEARAGEKPSAEVWVLEGEVDIGTGSRIPALSKLLLQSNALGWRQEAVPEAEVLALRRAQALAAASVPGREIIPAGSRLSLSGAQAVQGSGREAPGAYRWVTTLAQRGETTEVGLSFAVAGAWHEWVVGLQAIPRTAPNVDPEVVELLWDGRQVIGRVNGVPRFAADLDRAQDCLKPAARPGWGIRAWGGAVTVAQSRLQEGGRP